jgi:hypothetical protein
MDSMDCIDLMDECPLTQPTPPLGERGKSTPGLSKWSIKSMVSISSVYTPKP